MPDLATSRQDLATGWQDLAIGRQDLATGQQTPVGQGIDRIWGATPGLGTQWQLEPVCARPAPWAYPWIDARSLTVVDVVCRGVDNNDLGSE